MATTNQLVTWLVMRTGWNRDGARGIVPVLSETQNVLLQNECEQMLYYDPATGDFPFLNTTANVFAYNFPTNLWRVSNIVMSYPLSNNYGNFPMLNYNRQDNLQFPIQDVHIAGKKYMVFQQVRCHDKNAAIPASAMFTVDPGTQTSIYRYVGYRLPTPITSEAIQPEIPDRFHTSHLLPATQKLIEGFQTNNVAEARLWIEKEIVPSFLNQMNSGMQGRSGHTQRRPF